MTGGSKLIRYFLFGIGLLFLGCAVFQDPIVTDRPEPPKPWGTIEVESLLGECPKIDGRYEAVPEVVEWTPDNNTWGSRFEGEDYDYVLLFGPHRLNIRRPGATREVELEESVWDGSTFEIEQTNDDKFTLIVTNASDPTQVFTANYMQQQGDFACGGGEMIFPSYRFEGGTEGAHFNDLVSYSLFVTTSGDMLFYEQRHRGREPVRHRYYRFSRTRE